MSKIRKDTGDRLRALRLAAGLTQEKLAERAELHTTYIGQVERGEKNLTIESLSRLCGGLDITLAQFFAPMSAVDTTLTPEAAARQKSKRLCSICCRTCCTTKTSDSQSKPTAGLRHRHSTKKTRQQSTTLPSGFFF